MLEFNSVNNDCGCTPENLQQFSDPSCSNPSVITWQSLQGKPSCFIPCAHTHVPGDIIGLDNYIQNTIFANSIVNTNSIELTAPSGVLNANLKLSSNAGTGYKVPLSILSDGLIGQIPYASGVSSGILSFTDWIIFNNKFNTPNGTTNQYVRGDGSLATFPSIITTTRQINTASPLTGGGDLSTNRTLSITQASTSIDGYLSSTDWNTFDNKVTSVNGIAPIVSSGGKTPAISIPAATTSVSGYLTSTDWNTFNSKLSNSLVDGLIWIGNNSNIATPQTLTLNSIPGLFALSNTGELTFPNASTTERGLLTSVDWNTFNNKWTKPSFTTGSVLFWGASNIDENNSNFFWDNTLFKLKLKDSKLELLNTSLLGSALLEYKMVNGVQPMLVYDQTDSGSNGASYFKINCFNNDGTSDSGQIAGVQFGLIDPTITYPQTINNVGCFWNTPRATPDPNNNNILFLKNSYNSTGKIKIEANRFVQITGAALSGTQATYNFPSSSSVVNFNLPNNMFSFNYNNSSGFSHVIYLPNSSDVPDGYIAIIKALNAKGVGGNNVDIGFNGPNGFTTGDVFTFDGTVKCVIYRYSAVRNHWDIISIYP